MEKAILTSKSKKDLQLLLELAKKLGIKSKVLTDQEIEDMGLVKAIKEGKSGVNIDTEEFLKSLESS